MENILFKISYPAEFHAQTAVECAIKCHHKLRGHLEEIKTIKIETQESAMRIINKKGGSSGINVVFSNSDHPFI